MRIDTNVRYWPGALTGRQLQAYTVLKRLGAPVFVRSDRPDICALSAEDQGDDEKLWAQYYNPHGPWVDPQVDLILTPLGLFSEWENPACLFFWDI